MLWFSSLASLVILPSLTVFFFHVDHLGHLFSRQNLASIEKFHSFLEFVQKGMLHFLLMKNHKHSVFLLYILSVLSAVYLVLWVLQVGFCKTLQR